MRYICNICDFEYDFKGSGHMKEHRVGDKFKCNQCDHETNNYGALGYHVKAKHLVNFNCNQCEFKAKNYYNLYNHTQSKHSGNAFECDKCKFKANYEVDLLNHQHLRHLGIAIKCNQCDFEASSQSKLKYHKITKHDGITYDCPECDHTYTGKKNLKNHMNSKHSTKERITHTVYKCDQCGKVLTSSSGKTVHKLNAHSGIKYNCDLCHYKTGRKGNIKIHTQAMHEGIVSACALCKYETSTTRNLSLHIKTKHKTIYFVKYTAFCYINSKKGNNSPYMTPQTLSVKQIYHTCCLVVIYAVLTQNKCCCNLHTFVWRKKLSNTFCLEAK